MPDERRLPAKHRACRVRAPLIPTSENHEKFSLYETCHYQNGKLEILQMKSSCSDVGKALSPTCPPHLSLAIAVNAI